MNSDYEHNQQGLLFFVISGHNMSSNIIMIHIYIYIYIYIYMDSRLKGLSVESKKIRNEVQTNKF